VKDMEEPDKKEQGRPQWWDCIIWSYEPRRYPALIEAALWPALVALLLLGVIQYGATATRLSKKWPVIVDQVASQWDEKFPRVLIEDGAAYTEEAVRVTGELSIDGNKFPVIIDTAGTTKEMDPTWMHGMLLTTSEMVLKMPAPGGAPHQSRTPLREINKVFGKITLDSDGIREMGRKMLPKWLMSVFLQGILKFALVKVVHVFLGTLVSLIALGLLKSRVQYSMLVKLGFYALIPAVTVEALVFVASPLLPESLYSYLFAVYIAVYVAFLVMAALNISRVRQEREPGA